MIHSLRLLSLALFLLLCAGTASATSPAAVTASPSFASATLSSPDAQSSWKSRWKRWSRGHRHGGKKGGGGPASPTPEPATIIMMLLAGAGIIGAGFALRRRQSARLAH